MNNRQPEIVGRPAKILSRFPSFMRTERTGKVIAEIARSLGNDLDEAERLMALIQRSHRLAVADEEIDVLQLAALLGLQRADFLMLRRFYEEGFFTLQIENPSSDQEREEKAYAAYLNELKESVQRIVRIMLEGCGTLWALLEGTSILIDADTIIHPVRGRMEHTDCDSPQGGFIHRIRAKYSIIEKENEKKKRVQKEGFIYMVENPIVDKTTNKTLGALTVVVKDRANGNPILDANVTAIPTGDTGRPVRTGLYAGGGVNLYQVQQLLPGAYNVVVEADGFNPETRPITMDQIGGSQTLTVEITAKELLFPMPDLFGKALNVAIDDVTKAGFQVGRIIDSHGKEIPPSAIPEEAKVAAVLNQVPEPGTLIPKNTPVQIHISAKAEFVERVKVPDLRGLTLEEAKAKLEASRLVLGETRNVGK